MAERQRSREKGLVVLLGAGSSVEAGLLTSRDLTERIYSDISAKQRSGYSLILGYVISKLKTRNVKLGRSPYDPIEVEELFDSLSMLFRRDRSLLSEFVERWDSTISDYFVSYDTRAIESAVNRIVSGTVSASTRRGSFSFSPSSNDFLELARALQPKSTASQPEHAWADPQQPFYDALIRHLSVDETKVGYLQPIVQSTRTRLVATLNYDLALEKAAEQVGVETDYGLDLWENQKRVEWNTKTALRLLKLHGSINWTGNPENLEIRRGEIPAYERRVMIFGGTENKLSSAGPFLQFLNRFEQSLFSNSVLLVIGYSFRDPHINAVLQRWYLTRRNAEMTVIDKAPANLWQLGFSPSGGVLNLGGGRSKKLPPIRVIAKPASEGISEYFQEPTLQLEAAE